MRRGTLLGAVNYGAEGDGLMNDKIHYTLVAKLETLVTYYTEQVSLADELVQQHLADGQFTDAYGDDAERAIHAHFALEEVTAVLTAAQEGQASLRVALWKMLHYLTWQASAAASHWNNGYAAAQTAVHAQVVAGLLRTKQFDDLLAAVDLGHVRQE